MSERSVGETLRRWLRSLVRVDAPIPDTETESDSPTPTMAPDDNDDNNDARNRSDSDDSSTAGQNGGLSATAVGTPTAVETDEDSRQRAETTDDAPNNRSSDDAPNNGPTDDSVVETADSSSTKPYSNPATEPVEHGANGSSGGGGDDTPAGADEQPTDDSRTESFSPVDLSPSTWSTDGPPRTPPTATNDDHSATAQPAADWAELKAAGSVEGDGLSSSVGYLNRELSELSFQWRVLYEALDDENPPLERLKFLAILTKNMDEFFMKRIGGLKQQIDADVTEPTVDGRTPDEQWAEALEFARPIFETQTRCYHDAVKPALADHGIEIVEYDELSVDETAALRSYFERSVLPTLTPLTFDPAHPFPFISNLSLSLAVLTRDDDEKKFSRVKIPKNRPRLVPVLPENEAIGTAAEEYAREIETGRFVRLEQVVAENIDLLFPNVAVLDCSTFRVTRNAEVRRNEEVAEGLIEMIEDVLRQRRFATVVRLEVAEDMPDEVRSLLREQLDLNEQEVFELTEPLAFDDWFRLIEVDAPAIKLPAWEPQPHPRFVGHDSDRPDELFAEIASDDILVHHPYHSFTETVQTFLDAAAHDPKTLAIKIAIYRTAPDSQVIKSLIEAAKNGKQVAVMVELKARFDEENNLRWVKRLEEEGIHVTYGTIGLKTHSKVALAVREEDDTQGVRLYSHVATGNYHSETAKSYEDLGLFTDDRDIGQDLVRLFNYFTGHSQQESYRKLLVAPVTLRDRLTELIRREADHAQAGGDGRIVAKMNSLEDPEIVSELYAASQAGVDIELVVRGICRLRPGIEGLSETIRVQSIVGRFLEHSRIFKFGNNGEPEYYIGSADWMTRNLDRRVEAVAPVETPALQEKLDGILDTLTADNRKRWVMDAAGSYTQQRPDAGADATIAHEQLMKQAREAVPKTPVDHDADSAEQRETAVDLDEIYMNEPFEP